MFLGFITYGNLTCKYLPFFLDSISRQTHAGIRICAFDNTEETENKNTEYIEKHYPGIPILRQGSNIGFARGYNHLIKKARAERADYFVVTNPDTFWKPRAVENLINCLEKCGSLASVSPLVMQWDFASGRQSGKVDTCGIVSLPGLRFVDAFQGEDPERIKNHYNILGPSGAAGLYRMSALFDVEFGGQIFDERFFMYKEDVDLAYRLYLAGYGSACEKKAVVLHDRTVSSKGAGNLQIALNRKSKNKNTKIWSFHGQQMIIFKFWKKQSLYSKIKVIWYEAKVFLFMLLFERFLFKEIIQVWKSVRS